MASLVNSIKYCRQKQHPPIMPENRKRGNMTLISTLDKDIIRKKNYWPISLLNIDTKILKKILAN